MALSAALARDFPQSAGSHKTSRATPQYNCHAWGADDNQRWWQPLPAPPASPPWIVFFWPPSIRRDHTPASFIAAFGTVGFELCSDGSLEHGVEKIALYSSDRGEVTHTARQLPSGNWTSKLGPNIDIMHPTPESLNGPGYGSVSHFLQRQAQAVNVSETEIS